MMVNEVWMSVGFTCRLVVFSLGCSTASSVNLRKLQIHAKKKQKHTVHQGH